MQKNKMHLFSNSSSEQQYILNDIKKFCHKRLVQMSKLVWRKNPAREQIFRYFRYESRNNNRFAHFGTINSR